jgi:hypothetical protein
MKLAARLFALALLALLAAPALAQSGSAAPDPSASEAAGDDEAAWIKRLDEGAARIAAAQHEVQQLEDAKGRGAARRYPRGDAKEKYLDALAKAHTELQDAEEAMPELIEEARRAGVPPGVLDRYENPSSDAGDS